MEVDNGEVYYVPNYDTPERKLQRYNITDSLEKDTLGSTKNRLLFGSGNCELTIINSLQVDKESSTLLSTHIEVLSINSLIIHYIFKCYC